MEKKGSSMLAGHVTRRFTRRSLGRQTSAIVTCPEWNEGDSKYTKPEIEWGSREGDTLRESTVQGSRGGSRERWNRLNEEYVPTSKTLRYTR